MAKKKTKVKPPPDFVKAKRKVGGKTAQPQSATATAIRSRALAMPAQSMAVSSASSFPSTSSSTSAKTADPRRWRSAVSHLTHPNANMRRDALRTIAAAIKADTAVTSWTKNPSAVAATGKSAVGRRWLTRLAPAAVPSVDRKTTHL